MLYSVDHAVGLARDLADRISMRISGSSTLDTVTQSQDSNGYPILVITDGGNAAAGQPVVWIRLKNIDVSAVDIFGNSTLPFTPTLAQFAYELNAAGAPTPTAHDMTICLLETVRMGTVLAQIATANGVAVTTANVDAATPVQTLKDIDWGFKGNT